MAFGLKKRSCSKQRMRKTGACAGSTLICGKIPRDHMPLYEVRYGDSNVTVDACSLCYGIWLDRGEFIAIVEYLKEKGYQEVMQSYAKNLVQELWEVFSGPEMLHEEILDFLTILKLLRYKFLTQHPTISRLMLSLPR